MKKYLLRYFNPNKNEWGYANSVDENGYTYSLVPHKKDAERFYGKTAIKEIERRIKLDKKRWYGYSEYKIEEIDEEPEGYFELVYAISHYDSIYSPVKKGFLKFLTKTNKQKITIIHNLKIEMLKKYYYWRKENYKGKPKQY